MTIYKNILYLDFETSFQLDDRGKKDPSPFHKGNYLVSAGWCNSTEFKYVCFTHDKQESTPYNVTKLQEALNEADLLVAHNTKFELQWLEACGFVYNGPIHDTMLIAYVLARGQKWSLSLDTLCNRYDTKHKKLGYLVDDYLKQNIGFETMPWAVVQEYGTNDVLALKDLHETLLAELDNAPHLWPTVELTHEFCQCLADIEANGIKIDVAALDALEIEFTAELQQLKKQVQLTVAEVMGDTKTNIDSPEQLSQLIYSRKVLDKKAWAEAFNIGAELRGSVRKAKRKTHYSKKDFVQLVKTLTTPVYKTKAEHCEICHGRGNFHRTKIDGTLRERPNKCPNCGGMGYTLRALPQLAGLRCVPQGFHAVAVGGFSTDRETLEHLSNNKQPNSVAAIFLRASVRINQLSTYLETFVKGIRRGLRNDNTIHPKFMQHITATGRLSSTDPNFQNLPRGNTFPIRKCIISRWPGGRILGVDAKQLEFRIAGELSGSKMIFEDVSNGVDVHAQTSKHTGENRQDSKPITFQPIYGATEAGKSEKVAAYFRYFNARYRLGDWHSDMCSSIIASAGYYRTPSGREFYYGEVRRLPGGSFTNATQIKNYPVQSFATADIVPIVCIKAWQLFKQRSLKSCIILEAHDDLPVDVFPGEEAITVQLMLQAWQELPAELKRRYNYDLKMPLDVECKMGDNWLEMQNV